MTGPVLSLVRSSLLRLLSVFFAKFIVFSMRYDVFNVHAVISELNESDHAQVVTTDINDPPFFLVLEVIKTGKDGL